MGIWVASGKSVKLRRHERKETGIVILVLLSFIISLLFVVAAAAWFTRRLETVCDLLALPASVLSLLGALGANIPNYAASMVAIAGGHMDVGLGIIVGSNIYNVAIILGISTFAAGGRGIVLVHKEVRDVRSIARYALAIVLTVLLGIWLLPGTPFAVRLHGTALEFSLLTAVIVLALGIFGALVLHVLQRPHHTDEEVATGDGVAAAPGKPSLVMLLRPVGEAVLALGLALGGVVVMVQSGQGLTLALHMPQVLAGLLVLAVATSLPNTVVAVSLVRTDRVAACVEEIFSSNSINAALGIALPLLIWREMLNDRFLLILDAPLMVLLMLGALPGVLTGRIGRLMGVLLLLVYAVWVGVHVWL